MHSPDIANLYSFAFPTPTLQYYMLHVDLYSCVYNDMQGILKKGLSF